MLVDPRHPRPVKHLDIDPVRVRRAMRQANVDEAELARRLSVRKATATAVVRATTVVGRGTVERVAAELGGPVEDICT